MAFDDIIPHMSKSHKHQKSAASKSLDINVLRPLLVSLIANGQVDEALDQVFKLLLALRDDNALMTFRLAKLLRQKFGKSSEKISREQLELFRQSIEEALSTTPDPPLPDGKKKDDPLPRPPLPVLPTPEPRKRTGRNPLPPELPRERRRTGPSEEDQVCATCGTRKCIIGVECSETIEYRPAQFVVIVDERVKMACKPCEGEVVIAPVADKPIERGRPGPGLLAHIVISKFDDHMPLYRLSKSYARLGVFLSDSTLGSWVGVVAEYFEPVYFRLKELVLASYVLGVDDTPLKVLDRSHPAGIRRGHLWAYVGYEDIVPRRVVYHFTPTWEKEGPLTFLKNRTGYIQGDGYAGYEGLFGGNPAQAVKVGCWTHCRRKYKDALDSGDLRAAEPLEYIALLYDTERLATSRNATPEERQQLRNQYARPAAQRLLAWAVKNQPTIEPKSPLYKGITFTINQWNSLLVYLEEGAIPIDNNSVEQRMRPVAVGRKNYLFAGSDIGAQRAAILYTLIAACTLANRNAFHYLRDVIDRLSRGWPQSRLDELLPENWVPSPDPPLLPVASTDSEPDLAGALLPP